MSLIQEALKRQQQETDGTLPEADVTATPAAVPPAPPQAPKAPEPPAPTLTPKPSPAPAPAPKPEPAPAPPFRTPDGTPPEPKPSVAEPDGGPLDPEITSTEESEPRPTRMLPTLIGIILLIVLLLSAIGVAIIYGLQFAGIRMPWQPNPPPTAAAAPATSVAPQPATPSDPAPVPASRPAVAAHAASAAAPPTETAQTTPPATVTPAQPDAPADTPPPVATPRPAVIWPALKLKGIVGGGSSGAVMLNDKVVGVDETIEHVRVSDIEKSGAWLEYQGERRFLKVGKTLE